MPGHLGNSQPVLCLQQQVERAATQFVVGLEDFDVLEGRLPAVVVRLGVLVPVVDRLEGPGHFVADFQLLGLKHRLGLDEPQLLVANLRERAPQPQRDRELQPHVPAGLVPLELRAVGALQLRPFRARIAIGTKQVVAKPVQLVRRDEAELWIGQAAGGPQLQLVALDDPPLATQFTAAGERCRQAAVPVVHHGRVTRFVGGPDDPPIVGGQPAHPPQLQFNAIDSLVAPAATGAPQGSLGPRAGFEVLFASLGLVGPPAPLQPRARLGLHRPPGLQRRVAGLHQAVVIAIRLVQVPVQRLDVKHHQLDLLLELGQRDVTVDAGDYHPLVHPGNRLHVRVHRTGDAGELGSRPGPQGLLVAELQVPREHRREQLQQLIAVGVGPVLGHPHLRAIRHVLGDRRRELSGVLVQLPSRWNAPARERIVLDRRIRAVCQAAVEHRVERRQCRLDTPRTKQHPRFANRGLIDRQHLLTAVQQLVAWRLIIVASPGHLVVRQRQLNCFLQGHVPNVVMPAIIHRARVEAPHGGLGRGLAHLGFFNRQLRRHHILGPRLTPVAKGPIGPAAHRQGRRQAPDQQ